ncbi:uncharacterized protein BO88DRAFT_196730 [Aspergillus vadensis CBS 113365]|uniref:Uncharacterized protein n=1 Tax=Aspergillus vadensis (strain CBS 113365 / IMI 142717 / IBT 24658) TaxID=1448311 RepID=A0A319BC69_ASPVC|nr:hypothetical protein BO88DRAFT_196730 [Aspergillus vadensis CBS 113365]PYH63683.1 hypothetical protein BO88DRAFT_196730 [Aspergillus vadensis CBS 113365]
MKWIRYLFVPLVLSIVYSSYHIWPLPLKAIRARLRIRYQQHAFKPLSPVALAETIPNRGRIRSDQISADILI